MAGAELRLLHHHIGFPGDFGFHLLASRADHHHGASRAERGQTVDQVTQHRLAGDCVQHFVAGRFHARAHAGGKDDGGKVCGRSHEFSPATSAMG